MVLRRRNRNRALGAQLPAEAIFVLTSAQDIAKLIKIITFFFVQFAMRSGRHTCVPGSASTANEILISLQHLTTLALSEL